MADRVLFIGWGIPVRGLDHRALESGSADQIAGLRADEGFQRSTISAQLSVEGIRHIEGYTNEGAGNASMPACPCLHGNCPVCNQLS